MTRRFALQVSLAPVVIGFSATTEALQRQVRDRLPEKGLIVNSLMGVAQRICDRVEGLVPAPHFPTYSSNANCNVDVRPVHAIMLEEAVGAGLIHFAGEIGEEPTRGRFHIVNAVNEQTFMPKVGIFMYPSLHGYQGGILVRVVPRLQEEVSL